MATVSEKLLPEFKDRMHISHGAEDDNLKRILEASITNLQRLCGSFDVFSDPEAKELVFERSRYVYNDSLEFFENNFLGQILSLSLDKLPSEGGESND
ncbi:conserved hypothetical protein [Bacillus sp. 349Y]|nr:conserved hypothetical protein [Bacillus sp. 349Y]